MDKRYLCAAIEHSVQVPVPLSQESLPDFVGKPIILFTKIEGILRRIEPETVLKLSSNGQSKSVKTGILSPARLSALMERCERGEELFILRYRPKLNQATTEFMTRRPHGEVFPLTYSARLECVKSGLKDEQSIADKLKICSTVMRAKLRSIDPCQIRRQNVSGANNGGIPIYAHNLVVAPHPSILARIRAQRLPVDDVLEIAARRSIEAVERKRGAKICAFAGLHLEDSKTIRPHLHVRMAAYDSNGKYVTLFDRKKGSRKGNRVIFQDELERQITRLIERIDPRERHL